MGQQPRETVRVGIIGPSWWVNYWHLAALQHHPHAMITALCGAKERDAEEVKAKYGAGATFYSDMETMLETAPIDGVIVCTPNDLHHPATMAALNHGKHVTCEKPIALNAAQAREMAQTATEKHLLGMSNFPYRDNPCVMAFRRLVAEGYVGKILHVSGQYHGGFALMRPPGWRGQRARSGAGILGDLGSHLIDLARFITGDEFTSVCGHTITALRDQPDQQVWQKGAVQPAGSEITKIVRSENPEVGARNDDSCAFLAEFASGAQGLFHTSWVAYQGAYAQHQEIEVYGTTGRLHFIANHSGTQLRGLRVGEKHWETIPAEGAVPPGEVEEEDYFRPGRHTPTNTTYRWIEAIRQGESHVSPDLTEGWRAQQVIDAVIQASAERRWVDVER